MIVPYFLSFSEIRSFLSVAPQGFVTKIGLSTIEPSMPLIDTESEELTMAQYEELLGRINDLQAAVQSLSGDRVINTPEDGAPFYNQALSDLQNAGYINGTGESLDLTEDMARIITVMYRILKDKGIL